MGRSQIFEGIFSAITGNSSLMALLGTRTATNLRVYRNFAQMQSFLLGPPRYEPATAEGWLVIEEKAGETGNRGTQYETIMEIMDLNIHVFAPTYGLADDVADQLDGIFCWSVEQQQDVQYGNYFMFFSRPTQSSEQYAEGIKLCQKTRQYRLELVIDELQR